MMRWQISFQVRMGARVIGNKDDIMVVYGTMSIQSQFLFRIGNDIKESSLCCDEMAIILLGDVCNVLPVLDGCAEERHQKKHGTAGLVRDS